MCTLSIKYAICSIFFLSLARPGLGQGPVVSIRDQVRHAAGVALVEITSKKDAPNPPSDMDYSGGGGVPIWPTGPIVTFKIIKSNGFTPDSLFFKTGTAYSKAYSGKRNFEYPKVVFDPDKLIIGQRYWMAFLDSGDVHTHETGSNPNQLLNAWPSSDTEADTFFSQAIKNNAYAWMPKYDPTIGLIGGHLVTTPNQEWKFRVWRAEKLLWEKTIEGSPYFEFPCRKFFLQSTKHFPGGKPNKLAQASSIIKVKSLDETEFGLEEGTYRITRSFDSLSGKLRRIEIAQLQEGGHYQKLKELWLSRLEVLSKVVYFSPFIPEGNDGK